MAETHGRNSRIIIDGVVLKMHSFDLNMTQDKVDVTGFGDTNKRIVLGLKNFETSISGWWDTAVDKLFDVIDAGLAVNCYLYPDAVTAPTQYWWGSMYVEASMSSSVTSAVGISGSLSAAGNMTRSGLP